ncbi:MAG: hypothetical protein M1827_007482 [Pycnora praestabilis]|nr:MAG: hypothetical protein M1827_007482 [Pycnora praestabilis]
MAHSSITCSTKGTFPFLELPAEIRNKVYRLLLVRQSIALEGINDCRYGPVSLRKSPAEEEERICTKTFFINRRLYGESSYMFYTDNEFIVGNYLRLEAVLDFLQSRPQKSVEMMKALSLRIHFRLTGDLEALCEFIKEIMDLKRLRITLVVDDPRHFIDGPQKDYRTEFSWIQQLLVMKSLEASSICAIDPHKSCPFLAEFVQEPEAFIKDYLSRHRSRACCNTEGPTYSVEGRRN